MLHNTTRFTVLCSTQRDSKTKQDNQCWVQNFSVIAVFGHRRKQTLISLINLNYPFSMIYLSAFQFYISQEDLSVLFKGFNFVV